MFKFGFSVDDSKEKDDADDDFDWCDVQEVSLASIKDLSPENLKDVYSTFATGKLEIKQIVPSEAMRRAKCSGSETINHAEENHSDLVPGKYEGGLKIWECTRDLADFLSQNNSLDFKNKTVLDLGCGAGILGLITLIQGSQVVFQDYNKEVLELYTGQNVLLNVGDVTSQSVQFFSGDWKSFLQHYLTHLPGKLFDVILTSETIYNPKNYRKLHDVISKLLAPEGVCFLAGKSVYFGVGGSTRSFCDFVNAEGILDLRLCWSATQGIVREIYEIKHKAAGKGIGN